MDELKKILLFGVGAASITYEKATETIDELVQKGKLTVSEGKELGEELKRNLQEKANNMAEVKKEKDLEKGPLNKEDVLKIIAEYDLISRTEFNLLKEKVKELEEKLKEK